jgi:chromatin-remodeling ATPase INO80
MCLSRVTPLCVICLLVTPEAGSLTNLCPSQVVLDEAYFQRMKWQYMVLDEAQAIKSSQSARWKTLLGFHCRNRLLLTGTPIQNSMHGRLFHRLATEIIADSFCVELWALLHFIMPTLFDSHDEFSEWFAKDIENHAENKGNSNLNEHQLRRLHMILKPFMLRRVKRNVQNELGEKVCSVLVPSVDKRRTDCCFADRDRYLC